MNIYFKETWELWYFSMFRPYKLEEKLSKHQISKNDGFDGEYWIPRKFLLNSLSQRFSSQYILLLSFLCTPLVVLLLSSGKVLDWLLLPIVLSVAYVSGIYSIPFGLNLPFIFALVYDARPSSLSMDKLLSTTPQYLIGIAVFLACLSVTCYVTTYLLSRRIISKTYLLYSIGLSFSIILSLWLTTESFRQIDLSFIYSNRTLYPRAITSTIEQNYFSKIPYIGFIFLALKKMSMVNKENLILIDSGNRFCLLFLFLLPLWSYLYASRKKIIKRLNSSKFRSNHVFDFGPTHEMIELSSEILSIVITCTSFIFLLLIIVLSHTSNLGHGNIFIFGFISSLIGASFVVILSVFFSEVFKLILVFSLDFLLKISPFISILFCVASLPSNSISSITSFCLISFSFSSSISHSRINLLISTACLILFGSSNYYIFLCILCIYFRIFPDYLLYVYFITRFIFHNRNTRSTPRSLKSIIRKLPPHSSEILWLTLPFHDTILSDFFRDSPEEAFATFQEMKLIPLPGFQLTVQRSLPQIVATQMLAVDSISELLLTATKDHRFLPYLIPRFYHDNPREGIVYSSSFIQSRSVELSLIIPCLHDVLNDVDIVLHSRHIALKQKGLERIINNLTRISGELPKRGLRPAAVKRWEPVLSRWKHVIELEIEKQKKISHGELLNPFQYGNPLTLESPTLFKGRQNFVDQILHQVLARDRPTLALYGPRRCGKTSFLCNLPRLLPSYILPVFLDMQSSAITSDDAGFCQGLIRAIHRDSLIQGLKLPPIPQRESFFNSPYIILEDWLEKALPRLGKRTLLINIDEFEKIGSAIKAGKLNEDLLNELRHLIQHYNQIGFLFSGIQTLDELAPHWSNYFISVVPIEMLYLEPNEARELLEDPEPGFTLRYNTGIVDQILCLTRCQPYLLQLLGTAMVTQANQKHTQLITKPLLEAAIQAAFTNGEPYFINVWREFTGTSPQEVSAGQTILLNLVQGTQPILNQTEQTQAALRRMQRYHILESHQDHYQFEIPLVEQWVKERAIRD